jgi:hypothetical protein
MMAISPEKGVCRGIIFYYSNIIQIKYILHFEPLRIVHIFAH